MPPANLSPEYKELAELVLFLVGGSLLTIFKILDARRNKKRDTKIEEIAAASKTAADETKPNGGSSMRDLATKTGAAVSRLSVAVERIDRRTVYIQETMFLLGDHHGVAIFWTDNEGRNTQVNRYYCERLGLGKDELLGRQWQATVYEADREDYIAAFTRAAGSGARFRHPLRIWGPHRDKCIYAVAFAAPIWTEQVEADPRTGAAVEVQDGRAMVVEQYIGGWTECASIEDFNAERRRVGLPEVRLPEAVM